MAQDRSVRNRDSEPNAAGTGGMALACVRAGSQTRAGSDGVRRCGGGRCDVAWGLRIHSDTCTRIFMAEVYF